MGIPNQRSDELPGGSAPGEAGNTEDWQDEYVRQLEDETGWDPEAPRVADLRMVELMREGIGIIPTGTKTGN